MGGEGEGATAGTRYRYNVSFPFQRLFFGLRSSENDRPSAVSDVASADRQEEREGTDGFAVIKKGMIVIPDVEPETFQKVLDFVEGYGLAQQGTHQGAATEDENNNANAVASTFTLRSHRVAWDVRYAARVYGVEDLVRFCDNHLRTKLNYRNGMSFLALATENGAEDFKENIFKILKYRGVEVLKKARASQVKELQLDDVVALVRLFDYVSPDQVVNFVQLWGADMNHEVFREFFRGEFYPHICWERLSRRCMQQIHDANLLDSDREIDALLSMLWARKEDDNHDEDHSRRLNAWMAIRIRHRTFDFKKGMKVTRLLVKVAKKKGPLYFSGAVSSEDNYFALDGEVYHSFQLMEKGSDDQDLRRRRRRWQALDVDPADIQVDFSSWSCGDKGAEVAAPPPEKHFAVDLAAKAYYHPLEDSLVILISFQPVAVENLGANSGRSSARALSVRVRVAPELLPDARSGNLQRLPAVPSSPSRSLSSLRSLKAEVEAWESGCGTKDLRFGWPATSRVTAEATSGAKEGWSQERHLAFIAAIGFK